MGYDTAEYVFDPRRKFTRRSVFDPYELYAESEAPPADFAESSPDTPAAAPVVPEAPRVAPPEDVPLEMADVFKPRSALQAKLADLHARIQEGAQPRKVGALRNVFSRVAGAALGIR